MWHVKFIIIYVTRSDSTTRNSLSRNFLYPIFFVKYCSDIKKISWNSMPVKFQLIYIFYLRSFFPDRCKSNWKTEEINLGRRFRRKIFQYNSCSFFRPKILLSQNLIEFDPKLWITNGLSSFYRKWNTRVRLSRPSQKKK